MDSNNLVYRFTKISISDKKMSNLLYAIFMTNSKLHSYQHLDLEKYTRKQNSGHIVNVVICIKEDKIPEFEELSGVKLITSDDFQGTMKLN
jgi:tRNA A37 threonylcarbamoyladenosine modification protein TsaB